MQWIDYEYTRQNTVQKGQKVEGFLLAQSGAYCHCVIKAKWGTKGNGGVDPAAELKTMMSKFSDGSIFSMTKVALENSKAEYLGAPLKICVDLRKTKCTTMLQSLVEMPPAPAPSEELASILGLKCRQRVDLTALIMNTSAVRRETTPFGQKDIIDITVVDGSTRPNETEQVSAKIAIFFQSKREGRCVA